MIKMLSEIASYDTTFLVLHLEAAVLARSDSETEMAYRLIREIEIEAD